MGCQGVALLLLLWEALLLLLLLFLALLAMPPRMHMATLHLVALLQAVALPLATPQCQLEGECMASPPPPPLLLVLLLGA